MFHRPQAWDCDFLQSDCASLRGRRRLHEGVHVGGRQPVQPAAHPRVLRQLPEELLPGVTGGHAICAAGAPGSRHTPAVGQYWFGSSGLNVLAGMSKHASRPHGCFFFLSFSPLT